MFFQQLKKLHWEVGNWMKKSFQFFSVQTFALCNLNFILRKVSDFISILFVLIFSLLRLPLLVYVFRVQLRVGFCNHIHSVISSERNCWAMCVERSGTSKQGRSSWIISRKVHQVPPHPHAICYTQFSCCKSRENLYELNVESVFSSRFEFENLIFSCSFSHSHSTFLKFSLELFLDFSSRVIIFLSII